jgi:hypothetical protein
MPLLFPLLLPLLPELLLPLLLPLLLLPLPLLLRPPMLPPLLLLPLLPIAAAYGCTLGAAGCDVPRAVTPAAAAAAVANRSFMAVC